MDQEAKLFAERLNHALDLRNYPALGRGRINYVQEVFQISRAGANKWLHGKAIPHKVKRVEICQKLGISQSWLETGNGDPEQQEPEKFNANQLAHSINLLSLEQAYQYQQYVAKLDMEKVIVSSNIAPSAIAVRNAGDAMLPRFTSDTILIVDTKANINDGDFVVAKTAMLPEALFRQYVVGSAGTYLVSANPKFEPCKINEHSEIIGKVIEIRSQL